MALNDMTAYLWAMSALGDPDAEMYYGSNPTPEFLAYANALRGDVGMQRNVRDAMRNLLNNPEVITPDQESLMRTQAYDTLNMGRQQGLRQLNEQAAATGANAGAGGFMQMFNEMWNRNALQRSQAGTEIKLGVADVNRGARERALSLVGGWQSQRDMALSGIGQGYASQFMQNKFAASQAAKERSAANRRALIGAIGQAVGAIPGFANMFSGPPGATPAPRAEVNYGDVNPQTGRFDY